MDWEVRKIEKYYLEKKDSKNLYPNVENMTPQELREIVKDNSHLLLLYINLIQFRTNFIPKQKTKEELLKEIKYKKAWKQPGYCNGEFGPLIPLRGKVLDYWDQSRVNMPVRSYERYPVAKAIKYDLVGKEFGYDQSAKGTTEQYQKYLKHHTERFNHYKNHPSKYTKPTKFLAQIILDKPPFYVKKSDYSEFTFPKHNTFIYENRFRMKK